MFVKWVTLRIRFQFMFYSLCMSVQLRFCSSRFVRPLFQILRPTTVRLDVRRPYVVLYVIDWQIMFATIDAELANDWSFVQLNVVVWSMTCKLATFDLNLSRPLFAEHWPCENLFLSWTTFTLGYVLVTARYCIRPTLQPLFFYCVNRWNMAFYGQPWTVAPTDSPSAVHQVPDLARDADTLDRDLREEMTGLAI